jgi:hypothetical protein
MEVQQEGNLMNQRESNRFAGSPPAGHLMNYKSERSTHVDVFVSADCTSLGAYRSRWNALPLLPRPHISRMRTAIRNQIKMPDKAKKEILTSAKRRNVGGNIQPTQKQNNKEKKGRLMVAGRPSWNPEVGKRRERNERRHHQKAATDHPMN